MLLTQELKRNPDTAGRAGSSHSATSAFRDSRVWYSCFVYFALVVGLYGIAFWLPTILSDMGVKRPVEIGALTAIPYGIAAAGMILVGRSADRRREWRWHTALPALLGALGLVWSVQCASQPLLALCGLSVATVGILSSVPLFWSLPTAFLRGAAAASGIAMINSFGNLAGFASPYAMGWIKGTTGSTAGGLYGIALSLCIGAVMVLRTSAYRARA